MCVKLNLNVTLVCTHKIKRTDKTVMLKKMC